MRRTMEPIIDLASCGYPPISTAPGDARNWTDAAILAERQRLYAAASSNGSIWLIVNDAVWPDREIAPGKRVRTRPKPIPLEQGRRPVTEHPFVLPQELQF